MIWNDWLRVLRWRALEEGDADGKLVNMERRREATAHTRAGLTSEEVKGDALDDRTTSFVEKRSAWLDAEVRGDERGRGLFDGTIEVSPLATVRE